jgi:hypothetical protein
MIKVKVNMVSNDRDFGIFCAAMNGLLKCRAPHCDATCWAQALVSVQRDCDKGMTVCAAVKKWGYSTLKHKHGEEIIADILGVKDMDALRKYLSGETE